MFESSFTNHLPHLEGEEVSDSAKWPADCPFSIDNDSHHPNCVNLSHPRITVLTIVPNNVKDVCM
jgi:hypothetical protein